MRVAGRRVARSSVRAAALKGNEEGQFRDGFWVGNGLVAVAGYDGHAGKPPTPAGAQLIDTRTWTAQVLDSGATAVSRAGDVLLTVAALWEQGAAGSGLRGFALDGSPRFHLLGSTPLWIVGTTPSRAVVQKTNSGAAMLVDIQGGRLLRSLGTAGPQAQPLG
jgi:hypothetical protein